MSTQDFTNDTIKDYYFVEIYLMCTAFHESFIQCLLMNKGETNIVTSKWANEHKVNSSGKSGYITSDSSYIFASSSAIFEWMTSIGVMVSYRNGESRRISRLPATAVVPNVHKNNRSSTIATIPQSWSSCKLDIHSSS